MFLTSDTCWDILQIEQTHDKKVIKRAYHKLLRDNKPDEKPDEFQILYQAYQDALNNISSNEYLDFKEIEPHIEKSIPMDNLEYEERPVMTSENELFYTRVDALTYDNNDIEIFNNLNNWNFIEELGFSEDLKYHKQYAQYLFDAVNYIDKRFDNSILNVNIIFHFNNIFLWSKYWNQYPQNSAIFRYLDSRNIELIDMSYYIKFYQKIDTLTYNNSDINLLNSLDNWTFIEELEFSEEISTHKKIALYLFEALNQSDKKFLNQLLSSELIHYLNRKFLWDKPWNKYNKDTPIFEYLSTKNISYLTELSKLPLKTKLLTLTIDIAVAIIISISITKSLYMDPYKTSFFFFIFYGLPFIWFDIKTPGQYIMKLKVFEIGDNEVASTSHAASVIRVLLTIVSIYSLLSFIKNPFDINISLFIVLLNIYLLYTRSILFQDLWGTKVFKMENIS